MRISCPYCGPRGNEEFSYLGDASVRRPDPAGPDAARAFYEYVYLRDNPSGPHRELWYHGAGCRSWLVVTRNTRTHEITAVALVEAAAREPRA
jgi:sarcosine oxidase subunit delta